MGLGMTAACRRPLCESMALVCLALLIVAPLGAAEGPPPCEPPAGYVPPPVEVRIVGLLPDQLVRVGTTHQLEAEALNEDGVEWGDSFDWYVDGVHSASGPIFTWTVDSHKGEARVTLVVSSGDDAVWVHRDVTVGTASEGPPEWLGPLVRALPLVAVILWLALVQRQMARRRAPPGGSR